jgi:hypothetical protein
MIGLARRAAARPRSWSEAWRRRPWALPRGALLGVAGVLLLGAVYGLRPAAALSADPALAAAQATITARHVVLASDLLEQLRSRLQTAIGEGRRGAALTVQIGQAPGAHFDAAGILLGAADPLVPVIRAALADLAGDLIVVGRADAAPTLAVQPGRLAAIGAEMGSTGGAADAFQRLHQATATVLSSLGDALAALQGHRPAAALVALDSADASMAEIQAWPGQLATLPVWVDTTGKLVAAVRRLAVAVRDGDEAGAASAAAAYRNAAVDARQADAALAIAIAEGGNLVSGTAMAAAAEALRETEATLAAVQALGD